MFFSPFQPSAPTIFSPKKNTLDKLNNDSSLRPTKVVMFPNLPPTHISQHIPVSFRLKKNLPFRPVAEGHLAP